MMYFECASLIPRTWYDKTQLPKIESKQNLIVHRWIGRHAQADQYIFPIIGIISHRSN